MADPIIFLNIESESLSSRRRDPDTGQPTLVSAGSYDDTLEDYAAFLATTGYDRTLDISGPRIIVTHFKTDGRAHMRDLISCEAGDRATVIATLQALMTA